MRLCSATCDPPPRSDIDARPDAYQYGEAYVPSLVGTPGAIYKVRRQPGSPTPLDVGRVNRAACTAAVTSRQRLASRGSCLRRHA